MMIPDTDPRASAQARLLRESAPLLLRFLEGFNEGNRAVQAPSLPNHPIWILGHCAFTMARLAEVLGGPHPPASDFATGPRSGVPGPVDRFFIEDVAKDSTPSPDASRYPSLARGRAIFGSAVEAIATTVERMPPSKLDGTLDWGGTQHAVVSIINRVAIHNGIHAGQLTDLRRALGFALILPITPPSPQPARV
jgi:hypothetical protein